MNFKKLRYTFLCFGILGLLLCPVQAQINDDSVDTIATTESIQFGVGIPDEQIRIAFEGLATDQYTQYRYNGLIATSEPKQDVIQGQDTWIQKFYDPTLGDLIGVYNPDYFLVALITPESLEIANKELLGLPTSHSTINYTSWTEVLNSLFPTATDISVNIYSFFPDTIVTMDRASKKYSLYSYKSDGNIKIGEGFENANGTSSGYFRDTFFLKYQSLSKDHTIIPTSKIITNFSSSATITYQEVSYDTEGTGIIIFHPQEFTAYFIEPKIYSKLSKSDLMTLSYPQSDLVLTDKTNRYVQRFTTGNVFYNSDENRIEVAPNDTYSFRHTIEDQYVGKGSAPNSGNVAMLLLRVRYPDIDYSNSLSDQYYLDAFNSSAGYSFANYWKTVSGGKLNFITTVKTVMMDKPSIQYLTSKYNPNDSSTGTRVYLDKSVINKLALSDKIDWSLFDLSGRDGVPDGYIDSVTFMYEVPKNKIPAEYQAGSFGYMWPHAGNTSTYINSESINVSADSPIIFTEKPSSSVYYNGKEFLIGPYFSVTNDSGMSVFAHEFGHILGYTDFYDGDYSSIGLGMFSLMANSHLSFQNIVGDVFVSSGNLPQLLDAYSKKVIRWANVTEVKGLQNIVIYPSAQNNTIYKIGEGDEYILLENRQKFGFDRGLPDSGLAIYHVNEKNKFNTNEYAPRIRLIPFNNQYPLLKNQRGILWNTGSLLPESNAQPLISKKYSNNTNLDDGTMTGIEIRDIDAQSDYPNIRLTVYNPGPNNEYANIENNLKLSTESVDIDQNGAINEDDHTQLLKLYTSGQKEKSFLEPILQILRDNLNNNTVQFSTTVNPLELTSTSTIITPSTITLLVKTNHPVELKAYIDSNIAEDSHMIEFPKLSKEHTVTFKLLHPNTTYTVHYDATTAWGDELNKEKSTFKAFNYFTLPLSYVGGIVRSEYFDFEIPETTLREIGGIEECFSRLDNLVTKYENSWLKGKRIKLAEQSNATIAEIQVDANKVTLPKNYILDEENGLCSSSFNFEFFKAILDSIKSSGTVDKLLPATALEGIYLNFAFDIMQADHPNDPFIFRGKQYASYVDFTASYLVKISEDISTGTDPKVPPEDILLAYSTEFTKNQTYNLLETVYDFYNTGKDIFLLSQQEKNDRFALMFSYFYGEDASNILELSGITISKFAQAQIQNMVLHLDIPSLDIGFASTDDTMYNAFYTFNKNLLLVFQKSDPTSTIEGNSMVEKIHGLILQDITITYGNKKFVAYLIYNENTNKVYLVYKDTLNTLILNNLEMLLQDIQGNEIITTSSTTRKIPISDGKYVIVDSSLSRAYVQ